MASVHSLLTKRILRGLFKRSDRRAGGLMKKCWEKAVVSAVSLSLACPMLMITGCSKGEDAPEVTISEDDPWYSATITEVTPVLDPNDCMWAHTDVIGMAGDKMISLTQGQLMYDLSDFAPPECYKTYIDVYDSEGNFEYDEDLVQTVADYTGDPGAGVGGVYITGDKLSVEARWVDGTGPVSKVLEYDPVNREISAAVDKTEIGGFPIADTWSYYNVNADGYSICCFSVFTENSGNISDCGYAEFISAEGEQTVVCLEDAYPADDIIYIYDLLSLGDGKFCIEVQLFSSEYRYCYIDVNNGTVKDAAETDDFGWLYDIENINDYSYVDGFGNVRITQHGIIKLDLDAKAETTFLSYDSCNINRFDITGYKLISASDDKVILAGTNSRENFGLINMHDIHQYDTMIITLTRAQSNPHAGKALIRAASFEPVSYSMAEAIRLYNDSDSDAYIVLDPQYDYDTVASTIIPEADTDPEDLDLQVRAAMMNKLTIDLAAGDGPDLILGAADYTYLNREDLLLDLSDEVEIPNVYENIMESAKTGDKLYQVPLAFGLEGILADRDNVDTSVPGFTFDAYRDYISGPCNGTDPNGMNRLEFMTTCIAESSSSFMTEDGFDFDNEDFAGISDFVNGLVFPTDQQLEEEAFMLEHSTRGREAAFVNICSGMELLRITCNRVDEKVVMGFPSSDGRGLMIDVSQSIAVSAATKCPQSCKEFVRTLVTDDIQNIFARYDGLSVNSEAQAAACREFVSRANASYEIISEYWTPFDIENLNLFAGTSDADEVVEQIDGYIRNASGLRVVDGTVMIIIREEIQAYFAGQKTIDEVMDTIGNRVGLYESERG